MGKFSLSLSLSFFFFFFLSLAIPVELLSHISSLRLFSGHSGPVLTLSNAAHTSLFCPHLLVVDVSVWATSPLAFVVRCVICGFYLFIFSSWLCCSLRLQNSHRPVGERVSWCLETSPLSLLPPRDKSPSLTLLSLFLSFIFCPAPFEENGLPFWVPGVLHQHSEVVSNFWAHSFSQHSNDFSIYLWGRKWSPHPIPLPS